MLIIICQRTRRRHNVATILGREVRSCPKEGRNMAKIVQIKKNKANTWQVCGKLGKCFLERWTSMCTYIVRPTSASMFEFVWTINFAFSIRGLGSWGLSRWKRWPQNAGKRCQLLFMAPSNSQEQHQPCPRWSSQRDYDDDHFGCEVLLESRLGTLLQCGFPRKGNLMTPIKCAQRQLIVVDATTDMRF